MKLEDVILKGTRAQQPNFATVAIGTLYFVTDENKLERSSGAAWEIYQGVSGGAITQLTGDVTAGPGSGSVPATIPNNTITDAKLRDSAALSVIGRAANSIGDPADIAAGADDRLLTRIASALAFTQLSVGMIPDALVTYAKIQNISVTSRVLGRRTAGAGVTEEITLSELLDFIGSAAWGDILFRGTTAWQRLAAGTSGQFLKTNGAGANPAWADAGGGGGNVVLATTNLTDAQIKALGSTPVSLVAASAGNIIVPLAATLQIDKAAGAYSASTVWRFRYVGLAAGTLSAISVPLNTIADFIGHVKAPAAESFTNSTAVNAALQIVSDADVANGNVANSARIIVAYFLAPSLF